MHFPLCAEQVHGRGKSAPNAFCRDCVLGSSVFVGSHLLRRSKCKWGRRFEPSIGDKRGRFLNFHIQLCTSFPFQQRGGNEGGRERGKPARGGAEESGWATRGELGPGERGGGRERKGDCISLREGVRNETSSSRDACMHACMRLCLIFLKFLQWKERREGVGGGGRRKIKRGRRRNVKQPW